MQNLNKYILTAILILLFSHSYAQGRQKDTTGSVHLVGFDANTMLSQVIPFNRVNVASNSPAIISRRLWNGKGYRLAVGINNRASLNFISNLHISFGYTTKRNIGKNFSWIKGVDLQMSQRERQAFFGIEDVFSLGVVPYWGVEYTINSVISLSTESSLRLDLINDASISVSPPLHIQCHFNLK